ncbi:DNA cytosine methyltransferase [Gordonia alkaliphila]|uniref:DNA (cytosine-5-)-methyltransferase n=1 Tax=Gordonia alkaliphila TaxID=1053547 RepID=A0ABP8ZBV3_9ACTN
MIVDLFAGPGGLDVAAHWLGVPSIGIELDESAVDTREAAGLSTIWSDVTSWSPTDFTPAFNVLAGGPPCQTYTVAGNGHGRRALTRVIKLVELLGEGRVDEVLNEVSTHSDPRTGLVLQPLIWALKAIEANRPFEAIMLEQVPAVKPVWEAMAKVLRERGYGADVDVLRTEEFGVPQTRRRAVLIARRSVDDAEVVLPSPTHQKYVGTALDADPVLDFDAGLPQWVSMGEVLDVGEPFIVVSNYGSGGDPKNRSKRRHDRPAFTVTGKASRNKIVITRTGDDSRRFGPREAGRLQTFPDGYPWSGRDISQQVGNAIPPRLGAHVLNHLLGLGQVLDHEFFNGRGAKWQGPGPAEHFRVRSEIARVGVLGDTLQTVVGTSLSESPWGVGGLSQTVYTSS